MGCMVAVADRSPARYIFELNWRKMPSGPLAFALAIGATFPRRPLYVRGRNWGSGRVQAMTYLDAKTRAGLPDSAFAYVDSRGRRRLPINDEAHVRNALSRFNQTTFEDEEARDRAHPWRDRGSRDRDAHDADRPRDLLARRHRGLDRSTPAPWRSLLRVTGRRPQATPWRHPQVGWSRGRRPRRRVVRGLQTGGVGSGCRACYSAEGSRHSLARRPAGESQGRSAQRTPNVD